MGSSAVPQAAPVARIAFLTFHDGLLRPGTMFEDSARSVTHPPRGKGLAFDLRATRARTILTTALASVSYGWVLVQVQGKPQVTGTGPARCQPRRDTVFRTRDNKGHTAPVKKKVCLNATQIAPQSFPESYQDLTALA